MTAMTNTPQKQHWFVRTLRWSILGAIGLVYFCIFGEYYLRIMDPQVRMPRFITGTDYGIRGNIPNAVYRQVTPEADVEMRINGQGMRADRDFTLEKPAGTCRIGLLGDSYFMGYEAHYEDTIGHLLEVRLGERGYNVEVLNFSVSGFSTEESMHEFEKRAINYDPDILIMQFGSGDFGDNMRPRLYRLNENGDPEPTGGQYLPGVGIRDTLMQYSFYRFLINHSHFYSGVREWAGLTVKAILTAIGNRRDSIVVKEEGEAAPEVDENALSPRELQAQYTSKLLMLSRARAEEEGMEWFMFNVPAPIYQDYISSIDELTVDAATAARIIDPVPYFNQHPRDQLWLYRVEGHSHFSETGHDLSTDAIIDSFFAQTPDVFDGCRV